MRSHQIPWFADRRRTFASQADDGTKRPSMSENSGTELLTVEQMYLVDSAAIASGVSGVELMEAAGTAVVSEIRQRWASRKTVVLCGPGNNGGDGFVIARHLADAGWHVTLSLLGERDALNGDARHHADLWTGEIVPLSVSLLNDAELLVDAIFGAGLARPLDGTVLEIVRAIDDLEIPCIAVDVPTGVHGDSGMVLGEAPGAEMTVTFFRPKPGHFLMPGRARCGRLVVRDIGIPDTVLDGICSQVWHNDPENWLDNFPWPRPEDHKYTRGHTLIAGGSAMTGAGRLAAAAARRIGSGLVTIAASPEVLPTYTGDAPGLLGLPFRTAEEFGSILEDDRKNAVLVGPGGGVNRTTHDIVLNAARMGRSLVIDADGLTSFQDDPEELFAVLSGGDAVLTPHEGEFSRLFRMTGDKLTRAREAAAKSGAVVLLKGADTVVAAPDGRAAINTNAPPSMAIAGAGDVLAGTIVGLIAQGMTPFGAACAGAWITGDIASQFGPGLIAEDLAAGIPAALSRLQR